MFEQERVVVRLQQRILGETDVKACFLSGSHGRRSNDGFSDLDVALVFSDATSRKANWKNRRSFVRSVLPFVPARSFDADHVRPYFHIALYGNGAKVDYRYETKDALEPTAWDRDIHILKDSDGWCHQFQSAAAQASLVQPYLSTEELKANDDRFWVMFWDVLRLLLRGDGDKPFTIYLELLHFSLPPILRVLPADDPARLGLLKASYGPDTRKTARELAQLLDAYLGARAAVINRLNLDFVPDERFESAIYGLVNRHVL